jgi:hypothetical protein
MILEHFLTKIQAPFHLECIVFSEAEPIFIVPAAG